MLTAWGQQEDGHAVGIGTKPGGWLSSRAINKRRDTENVKGERGEGTHSEPLLGHSRGVGTACEMSDFL